MIDNDDINELLKEILAMPPGPVYPRKERFWPYRVLVFIKLVFTRYIPTQWKYRNYPTCDKYPLIADCWENANFDSLIRA